MGFESMPKPQAEGQDKTWKIVSQAEKAATTGEEMKAAKEARTEAWLSLRDLEGADQARLEQARVEAEDEVRKWENLGPEQAHEVENWQKRLQAVNERIADSTR